MDIVGLGDAITLDDKKVDSALVIVDRHSGWIEAVPVTKQGTTSKVVGTILADRWLEVFGTPSEIISDMGPQFIGGCFKTFCALRGIRRRTSIAYRSQSNGRAERAVQQVLEALRKLHLEDKCPWTTAVREH